MFGPPSQQDDQQLMLSYNQKVQEGNSAMEIAGQKMEDANTAISAGRYVEARSRISEAKSELLTAKSRYAEACTIATQSQSLTCPSTYEIDSCLLPMLDFLTKYSYLPEDIQQNCGIFGCSEEVKSDCIDLVSEATIIDSKCSTNFASGVRQNCKDIS